LIDREQVILIAQLGARLTNNHSKPKF